MFFKKQNSTEFIFGKADIILNSLTEAIVLHDKNYKILFFNESFKSFVGLKENELKDITVTTRMINDVKYSRLAILFFPSITAKNIKTTINNSAEVFDIEVLNPEELHFLIKNLTCNIENREYFVKIILDKTDIVKTSKESAEFLNIAAHHIRTPLGEIKWALESIKNTINHDNAEILDSVTKIIDNTVLLAEGILLSAQIETGKVRISEEENNIGEVIKNLLELFEESIKEKKISTDIDIDLSVSKFKFDKRILSVVLFAIIENAILYNRDSGKINIKVEKLKDKPLVQISVSDTGFGIPETEKPQIFEKYFRGKKAKEIKPQGFGLGVYLSKKLAELLGGNIGLTSTFNEGTTIFIQLPFK